MKNSIFRFCAMIASLALAGSAPAGAADETVVSDQIGREQVGQAESFREETQPIPSEAPAEAPAIEKAEEPEPPVDEDEGPRFLVREIRFEGNTIFPAADFAPYTAPYIGQTVSLRTLKFAAKAITGHYRSRGYINSRAYIGPQKIENGVITIRVIEAAIGKVTVEGSRYFSTELFQEALTLPPSDAFNYEDLAKRLRFVNRNPDFRAAAFLTPGEEAGRSDLHIKVEDSLPLHTAYEFNNRGTNLTHRSRHLVTGTHHNFLGRADSLSVTAAMAEQASFDAVSGGWSIPFWKTGTTFQLSGSYVQSALVKHLKSVEIEGTSWNVTPAILQEFISSPRQQLSLYAGLEVKDSKTAVDDLKVSLDRMRVWVIGPRWTLFDASGRTSMEADIHWGIPDILGGSEAEDANASRVGTGGDFVYYTGSISRLQRLPFGWIGVVRGDGQWSDGALTSLEQTRIGGYSTVRGYPESDSAGDYGFSGTTELLVPVPVPDGWLVPFTKERVNQSVRLAGFFDGGKVFNHDRQTTASVKDRMLMGAGVGVRVNLKKNLSAQFDYAWPLGDDSTDKIDNPQAHFSVRANL